MDNEGEEEEGREGKGAANERTDELSEGTAGEKRRTSYSSLPSSSSSLLSLTATPSLSVGTAWGKLLT